MDYRIIAGIALGLVGLYIAIRMLGEYAFGKLVDTELSHVLNADEHKVKGKYE